MVSINKPLITIEAAQPRLDAIQFTRPIYWEIKESQHWAVIGPNGAGKTLLVDILTGRYALKAGRIATLNGLRVSSFIKSVAFEDIYSLADLRNSYYQQRWNSGDELEVPKVESVLAGGDKERAGALVSAFNISGLMDKPINLLSSGELRKVLIIRSLLSKPKILIIDNPFIGLDALSRKLLSAMLEKLSALEGIQIVLVLSNPNDIPPFITDVLPVKGKTVLLPMKKSGFDGSEDFRRMLFEKENAGNIEELIPQSSDELRFNDALLFRNISVRYGTRTILKNINWRVRRGEKWALLGANGSGKSTLLSLVSGDNPQAYANDIVLFDRRRGSGESIWDIKSHIGYISPEMHLFYRKNVSCLDVVASGFFDTIGLYRKYNEVQGNTAMKWMKLLGIEGIKGSSFMHVSTGEQRLVLLARVFVKNPDLLVLDEPLHGLDIANRKRIKQIIDTFCTEGKSLIYVTHYEDEIPNTVTRRLCLSPQKGEQ